MTKLKIKVTSGDILKLLASKHAGDVLVDECKNGQSWGRNLLKMDAWVLRRTWSPLTTIGYEIKVSRQDFEADQKWTDIKLGEVYLKQALLAYIKTQGYRKLPSEDAMLAMVKESEVCDGNTVFVDVSVLLKLLGEKA